MARIKYPPGPSFLTGQVRDEVRTMIRLRVRLAALIVWGVTGLTATAQTNPIIWTGASTTSNNWSDVGNFLPARPLGPVPLDEVIFNNLSTARLTSNVMDGSYTIARLTVANPPGNVTVNFLTATDTLTATDALGIDLSAASATNLTFSPRFALGANQRWIVAGGRTLTMAGQVNTGGAIRSLTLNQDAAGTVGTAGTIVFGAANNFFTGSSLALRNGTLQVNDSGGLTGLTGGVALNPLSTGGGGTQYAGLDLNGTGSYTSLPLTLNSSATTLRSRLQATTSGGTATLPGAVNLAGGAGGFVELNVLNSSTLNVNGAVSGATYGGTLQLGGASGTGFVNNSVTLSTTNTGTLRKQDTSTWTLTAANAATAWGTTRVATGTLRVAAANSLASGASLVLGEGTTTGNLELFAASANQSVTGLSTGTDGTLDPSLNRIGIGFTGPGAGLSTLTYLGSTSLFNGTLANNAGSGSGNTLSLTLLGGDLTLGATNSYSGPTLISNSATLRLAPNGVAGFGNNGSLASSASINLNTSGSTLAVGTLTGGANYDFANNQFAVAANQTLRGVGTVTGNVSVLSSATIRGGLPTGTAGAIPGATDSPTGQLSIAGSLILRGGSAGTGGGQLAVDLNGTSTSGATVSTVAATGAVNVSTSAGALVIRLVNDSGLLPNTPYSFVVGSAVGGFQLNGSPVGAGGYSYPSDFTLSASRPDFYAFTNVTLTPDGGNNLVLSFSPVPEPATVLAVAAAGLAAVRVGRRRILAG